MARPTIRNHLLASLSSQDYALLEPHLTKVEFPTRQPFETCNKPIDTVLFPVDGIVSIVAKTNHEQAEAGIVGREGMTGIPIILGDDRWSNDALIQVAGSGLRIAATDLRQAMERSADMRTRFLAFVQAFLGQTTQTALANARGNVGMRLARWLLMAHDRLDGDELRLTHEFMALMLGVRRAGVTATVRELESKGLIVAERGLIVVADRKGLVRLADRLYGISEAEYRRLIPGSGLGTNKG